MFQYDYNFSIIVASGKEVLTAGLAQEHTVFIFTQSRVKLIASGEKSGYRRLAYCYLDDLTL